MPVTTSNEEQTVANASLKLKRENWINCFALAFHANPFASKSIHRTVTGMNDINIEKVRFNLIPEIHTMYAWSYAYRSARQGHWESFVRDRDRFRKRIENASKYLNPILSNEHRSFIYNTRFRNEV